MGGILFAKHEVEGEVAAAAAACGTEAEGKSSKVKGGDNGSGKGVAVIAKKKEIAVDAPLDVSRLDLRVATVIKVWRHPDAEKLYVESVDLGEAGGARQVVSGLVDHITESEMVGARVVVVANMKPSKMRGVESQAVVLCGTGPDGKTEFVVPPAGVPNGERVVFSTFPGEPDDVLNPKKKVFEAVQTGFEILSDSTAAFKGCPFGTSQGTCRLTTLTAGSIK